MEERDEELKKLFRDELAAVKNSQKTTVSAQVTKLEGAFKSHQQEFIMVQQMNDANSMQHEEARRQAMKSVKTRLDEIGRRVRGQTAITNELAWGVQELQTLQEQNTRGGLSHKLGEAVAGIFTTEKNNGSPTGSVCSTSTTGTWWRR